MMMHLGIKPFATFSKKTNYKISQPSFKIQCVFSRTDKLWNNNYDIGHKRRFCSKKGDHEDEGWKGDHDNEENLTEEEKKAREEERKRRAEEVKIIKEDLRVNWPGNMENAERDEAEVKSIRKRKRKPQDPTKDPTNKILIGEYRLPDPYWRYRTPDGKLLSKNGEEIPISEKTTLPRPFHSSDLDKYADDGTLSAAAQKRALRMTDERHEANMRELRLRAMQTAYALGMEGFKSNQDYPPIEELRKVWKYVLKPDPEKPISTVLFNYNAGTVDTSYYKAGDSLISIFRIVKFFRKHPEKKYLFWAGIFAVGVALALAIAIFDAIANDHSGEKDKSTAYFRARLVSTLGYTVAGAGATLLFSRIAVKQLLKTGRTKLFFTSLTALPLYCTFYTITHYNYPEDSDIGRLLLTGVLAAACGIGIATHSLRRGTGLVRLLVPVIFATTTLSASLAISPYKFNLEYGTPLAVICATLAGMFGASAVFNPYRTKLRGVLGGAFALTYAGLLLSYQQPYLNRIKFQEKYYGVDAYRHDTSLFLKSIFFLPLKAVDVYYDQQNKRFPAKAV